MKYIAKCFVACMLIGLISCQSDAQVYDLSDGIIPSSPESATTQTELELETVTPPSGIEGLVGSREYVDMFIETMSLEEKVSQLFMIPMISRGSFITAANQDYINSISDLQPGGIIVYRENIRSAEQIKTLLHTIQENMNIPATVAIDYEGGRVNRLKDIDDPLMKNHPSPAVLASIDDAAFIEKLAQHTGKQLRSLGITMNLAPLADVLTNPDNASIGDRAFGNDRALVSRMVSAYVEGLQSENVSAVLKHFPGQGGAQADTHEEVTVSYDSVEEIMDAVGPFRAGLNAGADALMSSHVVYKNIFDDELPTSLSPQLKVLMREQLKFSGLAITDSLGMRGVVGAVSSEDIFVLAVQAGNDILLKPASMTRARAALLQAIGSGKLSEERIDESVRRILYAKMKQELIQIDGDGFASLYKMPTGSYIGTAESQSLYRELVRKLQ